MGLIDRIRGAFTRKKPEVKTKDPKPKAYAYKHSPGYYGGDSGGAKWSLGLSADGRIRTMDHYRIRQNVRDMVQDSLDARAIVERMADSVVDTGLILEATPVPELLGISPEDAESWSRDVERRFHMWASDKKAHRSGSLTFYQAQRLYAFMQQRDNDVFTRLFYSGRRDLQNPLQFEFIDANQIRGAAWTNTYLQTNVGDGIERNPDGTEKSYKIFLKDPKQPGAYIDMDIPRVGPKSGRTFMLHGWTQEYAGQGRGFSRLGVAIQEMENLTDFTSAAIKKAINQSNMVFTVENQQKDPGNPLEGLEVSPGVSAAGINFAEQSEDTTEVIDQLTAPDVIPLEQTGLDTPGSMAFVGNEQGDMIRLLDTKAPADNFKEFVGVFTERLAAALNIPIEVVLMKFGQNYSASRATLLLFWRIVQQWRAEQAADWLNPIYEAWLSEEIASGRISAPGFADPRLRAAWLQCQWIGSPLPSIDPEKEARARRQNLEMNLTTLEREARNLNGTDAMTNIAKNAKVFPTMPAPYWADMGDRGTEGPEPDGDE